MATRGQDQIIWSWPASADLSSYQYRFMKLATGQLAIPATADGDGFEVVGVLQDKPEAAGRMGEVVLWGFSKLVAGEAISAGDDLMTEGNDSTGGRAKVATRNAAGTTYLAITGRALTAAGAAGDIFSAFVCCFPPLVANTTG